MTGKTDTENHGEIGQNLVLSDRKSLEISGVTDVMSFDESGAVLQTTNGILAIDGEGLHVTKLDINNGNVRIDGKINGLFFSDRKEQKGRKRVFK